MGRSSLRNSQVPVWKPTVTYPPGFTVRSPANMYLEYDHITASVGAATVGEAIDPSLDYANWRIRNDPTAVGDIVVMPDIGDPQVTQNGRKYLRSGNLLYATQALAVPSRLRSEGTVFVQQTQSQFLWGDIAGDGKGNWLTVGYNGKCWASADDGATWNDRGQMWSSSGVGASITTDGNGLWLSAAAADGTVIRSTATGANLGTGWTSAGSAALGSSSNSWGVRLEYVNGVLYATKLGTAIGTGTNNTQVFKSLNNAASWTAVSLPAFPAASNTYVQGVFGNGANSLAILIGSASIVQQASTTTSAYFSLDNGATFQAATQVSSYPAFGMLWSAELQKFIVLGTYFYSSGPTYYSEVRTYSSTFVLGELASYSGTESTVGLTPNDGTYCEPIAYGPGGIVMGTPRNRTIYNIGVNNSAVYAKIRFAVKPVGGSYQQPISQPSNMAVSVVRKAGSTILGQNPNGGSLQMVRSLPTVGLTTANKPTTDTSTFLRIA